MSGIRGRSGGSNKIPIELHRQRGTWRRDRHAVADPPATPPVAVEKPTWLSEMASPVWDQLAPVCQELGTLTPSDRFAFCVLCELESTGRWASSQKQPGRPWATKLERDTATALRPWYAMFALDPVSRARLRLTPPAATNPLDKYLNRKRTPSRWEGVLP